jgi:myo-inositol 2-dehydrogenase / D-chiro-inositol 1-dehydrogenase
MSQNASTDPIHPAKPFGRRRFIRGTAAAALAPALAAGAADPGASGPKLKLGVVGCGGRGRWIANLFRQHGGYAIHAVADYFPEVAAAAGEAFGVDPGRRFSGLSGYRKLMASGVDAVALETPPCFFPEHVRAAVEAGLHVFMAKPVAVDVPGCQQVAAAAARNTAQNRCFLVDYQMPTDPHVQECARRCREGALGRLTLVKSFYYGGIFTDSPPGPNIESRLQHLTWVNDINLGGSYLVNACIHPIQAMMWILGRSPIAANGISHRARPNPHGDSHDTFGIAYEFEDGLIWTHSGRHVNGRTGPADPLATCEFLGDAYMLVGYGGKALIRGGRQQYPESTIDDLYAAGATRNIATFHDHISRGRFANETVPMAIESCLATILAREACLRKGRMTMRELLDAKHALPPNLDGLKE